MKTLSLLGAVEMFATLHLELQHKQHQALERVGKLIKKEAKDVIGTYKYGWPSLAASTLAKKKADTPLLETGKMRDSIGYKVEHDKVTIGTDSEIAVWQEFGTSRIPPRPFLQGAAAAKVPETLKILGRATVAALSGDHVHGPNSVIQDD